MIKNILMQLTAGVCLLFAIFIPVGYALAEDYQGTTIESRVVLGFKANDAVVGAWLPNGWKPVTLPKGTLAGTNLIIALMDQHLIRDAEGKPKTPATNRVAAFYTYG